MSRGRNIKRLRSAALAEQSGRCARCGSRMASGSVTADHLIPIRAGGPTVRYNIVAVCFTCNQRKGDKITEADLQLAARRYIAARNGAQTMPINKILPNRPPDFLSDGTIEVRESDEAGARSAHLPAGTPVWLVDISDDELTAMDVSRDDLASAGVSGGIVYDWPGEPDWLRA